MEEKKKTDDGKAKALESVLVQIEKQYGKGAIMRLGDSAGDTTIEVIPSGCLRSTSRSASAACRAAGL